MRKKTIKYFLSFILIMSFMFSIGAKSLKGTTEEVNINKETNLIAKERKKKIEFEAKLAEIENKRKFEDFAKEQKRIVDIKTKQLEEEKIEEKIEEKKLKQNSLQASKTSKNINTRSEKKVSEKIKEVETVKESTKKTTEKLTEKPTEKEKIVRTDGFNFNGNHFSLASFSGGGKVPKETNNVYQWMDKPDHYLVERASPAGRVINNVGVGTEIIINGNSYTVTNIERDIPNNDAGVDFLYKHNAKITFQTCEITKGANGKSNLRFWYAR